MKRAGQEFDLEGKSSLSATLLDRELQASDALIAASDDKEDETTVYIDSMATSNFVAPNVDLSKAKTVNGPEVSIADGSSIKVKKTGLLDGLITAKVDV